MTLLCAMTAVAHNNPSQHKNPRPPARSSSTIGRPRKPYSRSGRHTPPSTGGPEAASGEPARELHPRTRAKPCQDARHLRHGRREQTDGDRRAQQSPRHQPHHHQLASAHLAPARAKPRPGQTSTSRQDQPPTPTSQHPPKRSPCDHQRGSRRTRATRSSPSAQRPDEPACPSATRTRASRAARTTQRVCARPRENRSSKVEPGFLLVMKKKQPRRRPRPRPHMGCRVDSITSSSPRPSETPAPSPARNPRTDCRSGGSPTEESQSRPDPARSDAPVFVRDQQ